jgi:hypothetical protein
MCSAEVSIPSGSKWPMVHGPTWDERHGHRARVGVTVEARSLPSPAPTWARGVSHSPTWDERHGHRARVGVTVEARSLPSPAPKIG